MKKQKKKKNNNLIEKRNRMIPFFYIPCKSNSYK